jgi:ribosomal protein S18 acetylase RimI-like enzyme
MDAVHLVRITQSERAQFETIAIKHYTELNPDFTPHEDWKSYYFRLIHDNPSMSLNWILFSDKPVGFILFGVEMHRFLPRKFGMIYELYVDPDYRRKGIGRRAAELAIIEMKKGQVQKIQLEVMLGNDKAAEMWRKLGFSGVSVRYVRVEESG